MDLERVKAIVDYYDWMLRKQEFLPEKFPDDEMIDDLSDFGNCGAKRHVRAMIAEMQSMIVEGRTEKCMRWLGFIQGVLWTDGMFTLEELKNHSRPDYPAPVIPSE